MKMFRYLMLLGAGLLVAAHTSAEKLPKWELGAGVGSQLLADYRGSEYYRAYLLPIPYLTYRGEFLRADDEGVRGLFYKNDHFELNVSADAALNGDSEDNPLRRGMPELDSAFEIGPSANFNLTGQDFSEGWSLRFPVRAVFTTDFTRIDHIGYLANPKLTYESLDWNGWDGTFNLGALYGSSDYHDYYYSVAPEYALPSRPRFSAAGGYSGSYVKLGASKRSGRLWFGAYLRYDYLDGAAFESSPLVETDHFVTVGLGVSWVFAVSREHVDFGE